MLELARRWYALVQAFSGGNAAIGLKMKRAYEAEPQVMQTRGMSRETFACIGKAMHADGMKLAR